MNEWAKVVTSPLGLAGFALFLLFGLLGRTKRQEDQRRLRRIAIFAALTCLVGGFVLSYIQVTHVPAPSTREQAPPQSSQGQENKDVQQNTTGPGSPAIQGVQGNVTVNTHQDSGTGAHPEKQPRPKGNSE